MTEPTRFGATATHPGCTLAELKELAEKASTDDTSDAMFLYAARNALLPLIERVEALEDHCYDVESGEVYLRLKAQHEADAERIRELEGEKQMNGIIKAAKKADWMQVVLNQGPPCFYLEEKQFCLRAQQWQGHDDMHKFVSLADLLTTLQAGAVRQTRGEMREVWLIESGDYEQRGVDCIAESVEAGVNWLKSCYGSPYVVRWDLTEGADTCCLVGHFESVPGYSTQHIGRFDLTRHGVVRIAALPDEPPMPLSDYVGAAPDLAKSTEEWMDRIRPDEPPATEGES